MSKVEVTVKSQKGKCFFGHKVGDKIVFDGKSVKGSICYSALMVLLPRVYAMRFGVEFPWSKDKDVIFNACPDAENPVIFEIRRLRKQPAQKVTVAVTPPDVRLIKLLYTLYKTLGTPHIICI